MAYLEIINTLANLIIALCAGAALIFAVRQIHISREVSSLSAYESYHLACLQYPEFATGLLDWRECDPIKRDCYLTFVLFALMTGERVLKLFPREETWIFAVKDDIRLHRDFIGSPDFKEFRENQDPAIRRLIDEVLSEPRAKTAPEVAENPVLAPAIEINGAPARSASME